MLYRYAWLETRKNNMTNKSEKTVAVPSLKEIQKECMSSDYNNVIATACKYCDVY